MRKLWERFLEALLRAMTEGDIKTWTGEIPHRTGQDGPQGSGWSHKQGKPHHEGAHDDTGQGSRDRPER